MIVMVLGASPKPDRYSFMASASLQKHGYLVANVGLHQGICAGLPIQTDFSPISDIGTVSIYVSPSNQGYWQDFIFAQNPKRLIFNPGTENLDLIKKAQERGIEVVEGCTLVMLASSTF